ncbi:MAG: ADP-ribosylglycohydrolase family protein [Clostridia bacterium]|nr:ADP-ribosylglycohydrolase family protein [Clostridia bacterium]
MLGAIIGDIVGSRFEWNNYRAKDFEFYHPKCEFTDDSIMTLAIAEAILREKGSMKKLSRETRHCMHEIGRPYPNSGYGGRFYQWMYSDNMGPYNSFGNGAAMRVSACGLAASSMDEAIGLSKAVTEVTHNHPEGIKGAEATAVAIYMAKAGCTKDEIRSSICESYYDIDFTIDEIRDTYKFNETCQDTVPQALEAFFESESFEDAIRIAISVGGDSDTLAAITGSIAEAYYGIPVKLREGAKEYLDERLLDILERFEKEYPPKIAG